MRFLYSVEYKGNIYRDLTATQMETTLRMFAMQYGKAFNTREVEIHVFMI